MKIPRSFFILIFGAALSSALADEVTVLALMESLKSGQVETRRAAALNLGLVGADAEAAIPALIEATRDADEVVACRAIRTLIAVRLSPETSIPALIDALSANRPAVRIAAAEALNQWRTAPEQVFPALVKALNDEHALVQAAAAKALGNVDLQKLPNGPAQIGNAAKPLLESKDDRVRIAAAGLLARHQLEPEATLAVLIPFLDFPDRAIRHEALTGIDRLGPLAVSASETIVSHFEFGDIHRHRMIGRTLLRIDPENGETILLDLLKKSGSAVSREVAVEGLAQCKSDEAVAGIVSTLRDRSADVRFRACLAVKKLGPVAESAAVNLAWLMQNDRSYHVRAAAADGLAAIDPENLQLLNGKLRRP